MTKDPAQVNGEGVHELPDIAVFVSDTYDLGEMSQAIVELLWDCSQENWGRRVTMAMAIARSAYSSACDLGERMEQAEVQLRSF